ncbi:MAG: metallophosphoesterase family protein [Clostridia bacterium]|nr:metallophosphoesterase family protein [Clostridia bacterium]
MTDILIFSDSHGNPDRVAEVLARNAARHVFFLGDGLRDLAFAPLGGRMVYCVRGNCDWTGLDDTPDEGVEMIDGLRIFYTHGHKYGVKSGLGAAIVAAAARNADVLLYGHTHNALEETLLAGTALGDGSTLKKPLLIICPGALGDRKGRFATLTVRDGVMLAGLGEL